MHATRSEEGPWQGSGSRVCSSIRGSMCCGSSLDLKRVAVIVVAAVVLDVVEWD
jgi:hypothetical protein